MSPICSRKAEERVQSKGKGVKKAEAVLGFEDRA